MADSPNPKENQPSTSKQIDFFPRAGEQDGFRMEGVYTRIPGSPNRVQFQATGYVDRAPNTRLRLKGTADLSAENKSERRRSTSSTRVTRTTTVQRRSRSFTSSDQSSGIDRARTASEASTMSTSPADDAGRVDESTSGQRKQSMDDANWVRLQEAMARGRVTARRGKRRYSGEQRLNVDSDAGSNGTAGSFVGGWMTPEEVRDSFGSEVESGDSTEEEISGDDVFLSEESQDASDEEATSSTSQRRRSERNSVRRALYFSTDEEHDSDEYHDSSIASEDNEDDETASEQEESARDTLTEYAREAIAASSLNAFEISGTAAVFAVATVDSLLKRVLNNAARQAHENFRDMIRPEDIRTGCSPDVDEPLAELMKNVIVPRNYILEPED